MDISTLFPCFIPTFPCYLQGFDIPLFLISMSSGNNVPSVPNLFSNIFSKLTLTSFAHSLTHFVCSLTHSLSLVPLATARLYHSFVLSSLSLAHSLRSFRSLFQLADFFVKMLENKFLTEGTLLPLLTLLLLQTLQTLSPLERS